MFTLIGLGTVIGRVPAQRALERVDPVSSGRDRLDSCSRTRRKPELLHLLIYESHLLINDREQRALLDVAAGSFHQQPGYAGLDLFGHQLLCRNERCIAFAQITERHAVDLAQDADAGQHWRK